MSKVKFKRITTDNDIVNLDVEDGSFIVTKNGKIYIDFENERVAVGGTPDLEMNDASVNSVQNKVIKKYIDDEVKKINSKNGFILWENTGSHNSFAAQEVTFSTDDYDYFEVLALAYMDQRKMQVTRCYKGYSSTLNTIFGYNGKMYWGSRDINRISDTKYSILGAITFGSGPNEPLRMNVPEWIIPIKIVGYKF